MELDNALDELLDEDDPISSEGFYRDLLESDEYLMNRTDGTPDGFLDAVFMDLLGRRPADNQERQDITRGLDLRNPFDRREVVRRVMDSGEYCDKLARQLFERYLRRPPSSSVDDRTLLGNLADEWDDGASEDDLIAEILASDGYFKNAGCIVTFDKGTMPGDAFFQMLLGIVPTVPGTNVNIAFVTSANDPNDANNIANTPTDVQRPRVTIIRTNGRVVIKWPSDAAGFTVERSTGVKNWMPVSAAVMDDGMSKSITLSFDASQLALFFRLSTGYFDYCVVSPSGAAEIAFNSLTGEYCARCPDAAPRRGKGEVRRSGPVIFLEDNDNAGVTINTATGTGSGFIDCDGMRVSFTDPNIHDNSCAVE
jgi:hypothetical protein